jgi:hypothetical protein
MPYSIRKLPNKDLYRVYNSDTKAVHSYATTLENAEKQVKLLHMVDAGVPLKKQGDGIRDIQKLSRRTDLSSLHRRLNPNDIEELLLPDEEMIINPSYDPNYNQFLERNRNRIIPNLIRRQERLNIEAIPNEDLLRLRQEEFDIGNYNAEIAPLLLINNEIERRGLDDNSNYSSNSSNSSITGGAITSIDKTSTGVMRIKLNDSAKNFLDDKLIPLISNTTIRVNDSRVNTGTGRTQVFGYGNLRSRGFGEFKNNTDYPELYRALLIFGMKVIPDYIPFTAIQVNHNYKTKKHIDGNNLGLSLAVSFGDFTGGELVIGKKEYQTKLHPVIFNGALTEHFNKPIKGNRYSLVYFVSAPKNYSDGDIYNLHNKIVSKIKLKKGEGLIGGSIETDNFYDKEIVSIPEFKSVKMTLPTYMYKRLPDIDGKPPLYKYKLVIPITSSRNISSRKAEKSIVINQKPVAKAIVSIDKNKEKPTLDDFSPEDQDKLTEYYDKVEENENKSPDEIQNDSYKIVPRGKPLPCPNVKKSKKEKPVKEKVVKEKGVKGRPKNPKKEIVLGNREETISIEPPEEKEEDTLDKEDEDLLLNNYEEFKKKYGLESKRGKGLENIVSTDNIKMPNKWVAYVKSYASKHNMSYRDALRDPKLKAGYKKGGAMPVEEQRKRRENQEEFTPDIVYDNYAAAIQRWNSSAQDNAAIMLELSLYNELFHNAPINTTQEIIDRFNEYYNWVSHLQPRVGGKIKKGRGVVDELGNQELIAEVYNMSQLGANAGKKFISL